MPLIYHDVRYNSNDHTNIYTGFSGNNIENVVQNSNQNFNWSVDNETVMTLSGTGSMSIVDGISACNTISASVLQGSNVYGSNFYGLNLYVNSNLIVDSFGTVLPLQAFSNFVTPIILFGSNQVSTTTNSLSNYLPISGGILTGSLAVASITGSNATFCNLNVAGTLTI